MNDKLYRSAAMYIRQHYTDHRLSLRSLAELYGVSRWYFLRQFRKVVGVSPKQYIIRLRIAAAKQLLRDTDNSAGDIANGLGFCSHSHFTRRFHQVVGKTPEQWRAEHSERVIN